jgi:antitoxin component of RelBE/YafQ-DinJ toxin-antitoxin module
MADRDRALPSAYFRTASRASNAPASHLISIRLPDDLVQRLAAVGNEEGLAMSDTIRLVLERGLTATRQPASRRSAKSAASTTAAKRKRSST